MIQQKLIYSSFKNALLYLQQYVISTQIKIHHEYPKIMMINRVKNKRKIRYVHVFAVQQVYCKKKTTNNCKQMKFIVTFAQLTATKRVPQWSNARRKRYNINRDDDTKIDINIILLSFVARPMMVTRTTLSNGMPMTVESAVDFQNAPPPCDTRIFIVRGNAAATRVSSGQTYFGESHRAQWDKCNFGKLF